MSSRKFGTLVHQTTTGLGTGNLTLIATGAGDQTFDAVFSHGVTQNVFDYFIRSQVAGEWERGTGHLSDASTLVRDTVKESSNANALVNFSAGTKDVTNDAPADCFRVVTSGDGFFDDAGNELLLFTKTASAVNGLTLANAATGNAPLLQASGTDANITFDIYGKGTGGVRMGALALDNIGIGMFGYGSPYTSLIVGNISGITANNGGLYAVARKDKANSPFTAISGWDNGTDTAIYYGGGGWGCPDATKHLFYAASAYPTNTNDTGAFIFGIDTNGPSSAKNLKFTVDSTGIVDGNANELLLFSKTASAVNYVNIANSATTAYPTISAAGDDADIGFIFTCKGAPTNIDSFTFNGGSADFPAFTFKGTSSGAGGPYWQAMHTSASPAVNDNLGFAFYARNDLAANKAYGNIYVNLLDVTHGTEDAEIIFSPLVAGASVSAMKVANGVQVGAPTGGYEGTGTINAASDYKVNGNSILIEPIEFVIDGGGSAIATGMKGYLRVPYACTIQSATLLADQSGSIVVNIYKCSYANFDAGSTHPVAADKITSTTPPTISAATKSEDTTLTSWTTAIAAGDVLAFNVDSASTVTRVTLALKVVRT